MNKSPHSHKALPYDMGTNVFPTPSPTRDSTKGEAGISPLQLTDLCLACTRCGWECAASAGGGRSGGANGNTGAGLDRGGLSVHVGVGCGRVSCFHVGSDQRGWQLVVSGVLFEEQVREDGGPRYARQWPAAGMISYPMHHYRTLL